VRSYAEQFNELLAELNHSLVSGGAGIDREPAAIIRDLDDAVNSQLDFTEKLEALDKEPNGDANVRAVATENGGLCEIKFYAREDVPNLKQRASRGGDRATVHLRAMRLLADGFRYKQPPRRCVVCSKVVNKARLLQLIMVLDGYGEDLAGYGEGVEGCGESPAGYDEGPARTVARAICVHCASKHQSQAALRDAVVNAFRERLQVNLRALPSAPMLPGRLQ
jgi:hypothetical protein